MADAHTLEVLGWQLEDSVLRNEATFLHKPCPGSFYLHQQAIAINRQYGFSSVGTPQLMRMFL